MRSKMAFITRSHSTPIYQIDLYSMTERPPSDRLHGVTLEAMLTALVAHHSWTGLAQRIDVRCFKNDPTIKSSLTFLRRTPWARQQVEALYLQLTS